MVCYGLQLLSPNYFFVTACAITAIVAASIGSSWTVVGTIGVGFTALPTAWTSTRRSRRAPSFGRLFRRQVLALCPIRPTSPPPLPASTSTSTFARPLLSSTVALAIALAVFFTWGAQAISRPRKDGGDPRRLRDHAFAVPASAGGDRIGALLKVLAFTAIFLGSVAGGVLAVIVAPGRVVAFADAPEPPGWLALLKGTWLALASGYKSTTGFAPIDLLASRGGMDSMLNTIWLIVTALAFGGVVESPASTA